MKINSISISGSKFESPFELAKCNESSSSWITVLIGSNGCRKSLLLRLLTEASLGHKVYKGHGHSPLKISLNTASSILPAKVIAVSGTPLDRFPRGGTREVTSKNRSLYERPNYIYLGLRASNGVVGSLQGERNLSRVFLNYSAALESRKESLTRVFGHLGLQPALGYRLKKSKNVREKGGNGKWFFSEEKFKQHLINLPELLANQLDRPYETKEWKQELKAFAEFVQNNEKFRVKFKSALSNLQESQIEFWLSPTMHPQFSGDISIIDWRCAIAFDFVDIDGLCFVNTGTNVYPGVAKETIRDSDLSSGQWSWLSSLAGLALELCDNAIVLIDEPENSLHPTWQRQYVGVLDEILRSSDGCHAIVATHSSFVASGLSSRMGNIQMIRATKNIGEEDGLYIISRSIESGYGWDSSDVFQDIFGLDSTRAPDFIQRVDKALSIVRGGASDKNELEQLLIQLGQDSKSLPVHDVMREILESLIEDANLKSVR